MEDGGEFPEPAALSSIFHPLSSFFTMHCIRALVSPQITSFGREVCEEWPSHVYQWHREGFDLPAGAKLLAEGDIFEVQAFRYGPAAFGVQFHAEVTHAMMCRWTTRGHTRMEMPGARPRAAHYADRPVYDPAIRRWLADFLDRWIGADAIA